MEQQARKALDKALQIYRTEMNGVVGNVLNKDMSSMEKTHKQLEEQLKKYLQKELRGYSKLSEITDNMMVTITVKVK